MRFNELKQEKHSLINTIRKRVSDKAESELKLADASTADKAQSQETKRNTLLQRKDKAEKSQCEVRGLTASSPDKSHCQEMKISTSADTVILAD